MAQLRLETVNVSFPNERASNRSNNQQGGGLVGEFVALSVADTGTGMPPGILEKVFEPFFTTKEIGAGSGLGLSMVQGFAQQASGAVRIASEVGRGTTVTLYLPRSREAAPAFQADEAGNGSGTILLVDDDPAVRSVTAQLLELSGYAVIAVGSAAEALTCFGQAGGKIDLLITDLVLEDGPTGIDLACKIRSQCPGQPVLLVSSYSDTLRADPRLAGIDILSKPFAHSVLLQAISRAMRPLGRRVTKIPQRVTPL